MPGNGTILDAVRAALRSEAKVDISRHPLALELVAGNILIMEGELPDISAKKLALERAAAVAGVDGVVDRLRVMPAQRMGDGAIGDALRTSFLQEPAFAAFAIRERRGDRTDVIRQPDSQGSFIEYEVGDGVVTLNGEVPGLGHKRLAGILAWWIPGSRDVVNGIAEVPTEQDNDAEVADAVRLALEKDVFVNASQVRASVRDYKVTLEGQVSSDIERRMAERDAWYVFGVDQVLNQLVVRP
ncbi:MAG: BON domain-containing protein [Rhodospirillales bacterium]|nr:MAG: BON domain-containing protein [Rhodospirillales bacterium]